LPKKLKGDDNNEEIAKKYSAKILERMERGCKRVEVPQNGIHKHGSFYRKSVLRASFQ